MNWEEEEKECKGKAEKEKDERKGGTEGQREDEWYKTSFDFLSKFVH